METLPASSSTKDQAMAVPAEHPAEQKANQKLDPMLASVIEMPRGLPGFPSAGHFVLEPLGPEQAQLLRFRSTDHDGLAFLVLPIPGNLPVIAEQDFNAACVTQEFNPSDVMVFLIVTIEQNNDGILLFANLRAPLLVETERKIGAQVVLQSPGYPLRYALQPA